MLLGIEDACVFGALCVAELARPGLPPTISFFRLAVVYRSCILLSRGVV